MKICIVGYAYIRENLFEVFEYYPEKKNLYFILPKAWKVKKGKVIYLPPKSKDIKIYTTKTLFHHSNYPIIGGLLKGWMPALIWRLPYLKWKHKIDVLFTASEPNLLTTIYNALIARILGIKHIFFFWENIPHETKHSGLKLKIVRLLIKISIFLSQGAICGNHKAEKILKSYNSEIKTVVFPISGLDSERFNSLAKPTLRYKLNLGQKITFLFVGALNFGKGIHNIIEAFRKVLKKKKNIHLIIVGNGPYENVLKKRTKDYHLQKKVTFINWLPSRELPSVFCSADIFLYPSIPYKGWEEQFGYSIAEASLCKKPIISTKTGSINEVVADSQTGILIEPDNVQALQEAMLKLANDRTLREKMGQAGRKYIKEYYGHQIIAKKMYKFFKSI